MKKTICITLAVFLVVGCSLHPYEEEFTCDKAKYAGKCQSTEEAYKNSLVEEEDQTSQSTKPGNKKKDLSSPKELYQRLSFTKINSLLKKPTTPILSPPKTIRILFLSKQDQEKATFSTPHYVYMILEPAKFILSRPMEK